MPIIKAVKKLRKPIKMSVEERTSGLLKEGRDYKTGSEGAAPAASASSQWQPY